MSGSLGVDFTYLLDGKAIERIGDAALSRKADFRLGRRQYREAAWLFLCACEVAEAQPAKTPNHALHHLARAGLALAEGGFHADAERILDEVVGRKGVGTHLLEAAFVVLLESRTGDDARFKGLFWEAVSLVATSGRLLPWVHPHQEKLLELCSAPGRERELSWVIAATRRSRGSAMPRRLKKRIAELDTATLPDVGEALDRLGFPPRAAAAFPVAARAARPVATRGVYFALTSAQMAELLTARTDPARRAYIAAIEESWNREWLCETDKAWGPLHELFSISPSSDAPIDLFFGRLIHKGTAHIITEIEPARLTSINSRLARIDELRFREAYFSASADALRFGETVAASEDRVRYLWTWLARIRDFLVRAEEARRTPVFTAAGR